MSATAAELALDPAGASLGLFLVVVFPQRTGSPIALLELARRADVYAEGDVQGRQSHFAGFGPTAPQASLALKLQARLRNRDYVDQYAGGNLIDNRYPDRVIECYRDALKCGDTRAHCVTVESRSALFVDASRAPALVYEQLMSDLAAESPPQRYVFPCSFLRTQGFRIDIDHVSVPRAQITAAAVRYGCDFCPLFDASQFKAL